MIPRRLRTRVTVLLVGGALVLSTALALTSYQLTRRTLLAERERTAVRAAYFDAAVVRAGVAAEDADVVAALRALDTGQNRRPLVRRDGTWYARTADDGLTEAVPQRLIALVGAGRPAVQRVHLGGEPAVVVGVPFRDGGTAFYEVQSLAEVQATLRTVGGTLAGAAVLATAAATALSLWVARRVLRPLGVVAQRAQQVAEGDLSVRLPADPDPDLEVLVRSFNDMVGAVERQVAREKRFAADVSHELRSPLQTLTSATQVLLNRADGLDDRGRAAAELLGRESERFVVLVQALLDLARADRPLQPASTDVVSLARRVAERHGVPSERLHAPSEHLLWCLEEQRVEQVLDNVLANARKHGGGVLALDLQVIRGELQIDVDDGGPGVPLDEREAVFDRFGRGRAAHAREGDDGVGLGLSLVAEHVHAHGGQVLVLDRPGGGCRMRVTLPWTPL